MRNFYSLALLPRGSRLVVLIASMLATLVATIVATLVATTGPALGEGELVPVDPNDTGGEVIIEDGRANVVDEFRINGRLYMIRVNPRKGPSYFLVDADGDGDLETRSNELAPNLLIPAWVLKRW